MKLKISCKCQKSQSDNIEKIFKNTLKPRISDFERIDSMKSTWYSKYTFIYNTDGIELLKEALMPLLRVKKMYDLDLKMEFEI